MAIDWKSVASLAELGGNVALNVLAAEGIVPQNSATLAVGIESALNPLLSAIQNKQPAQVDIMAGYAALIGSLNAVKQQTGLAPELLNRVTEYLAAAEAAATASITAAAGFNPGLFVVNPPIEGPTQ
jgi:hypothetical protein